MTGRCARSLFLWLAVCQLVVMVHGQNARGADWATELERALGEFDEAQRVQASTPDRARQLFRSSAQRFESIVAAGVVNGKLEYNLGNSYLQSGDVGRAILHYRRAQRLIPNDPLLAENLSVARSRCLTNIRLSASSKALKTIFFWHYQTSTAARLRLAVVAYVGIWILITARGWTRRRGVTIAAVVAAAVAGSLGASTAVSRWSDRNAPDGVVIGVDVAVHKGPGAGYNRQFEQPLQPGVEFTLKERRGGWWNVELTDGKTGWVDTVHAELIPTQRREAFQLSLD